MIQYNVQRSPCFALNLIFCICWTLFFHACFMVWFAILHFIWQAFYDHENDSWFLMNLRCCNAVCFLFQRMEYVGLASFRHLLRNHVASLAMPSLLFSAPEMLFLAIFKSGFLFWVFLFECMTTVQPMMQRSRQHVRLRCFISLCILRLHVLCGFDDKKNVNFDYVFCCGLCRSWWW